MKTRVLITIGDINGIGPEIILKTLRRKSVTSKYNITVISPLKVLEYWAGITKIDFTSLDFSLIDLPVRNLKISPSKSTAIAGKISAEAILIGAELCMGKTYDVLVTSPVSKNSLRLASVKFPGHTEMLEKLTGSSACMIMISELLRVALLTNHPPLRKVSNLITEKNFRKKLEICIEFLIRDLRLKNPSLAVLGINPHAGDEGALGKEESEIMEPVIKEFKAKYKNVIIEGPYSADGFFGSKKYRDFDLIVTAYHDQGLIPFKMLSGFKGINYSAGLPFVRTSPDHGTAFEIAGKNLADETSMVLAISMAERIHKNKSRRY
ncbi:MAG: 4-hydroxythreonine-4-phosphate dehydrogenase PdxA [Ignavibacteria bacterium]|nr:4-hydroxythreonine-4-phosphate dehydrogenase PdxA [Ignavibacteria bacterium]